MGIYKPFVSTELYFIGKFSATHIAFLRNAFYTLFLQTFRSTELYGTHFYLGKFSYTFPRTFFLSVTERIYWKFSTFFFLFQTFRSYGTLFYLKFSAYSVPAERISIVHYFTNLSFLQTFIY